MVALIAAAVALADPAAVARGERIFAASCGIGYCHGKAGAAGRGPRLAGRKFEPEFLTKVISQGTAEGNMPGFAKQYSRDDIAAVVAYVLSLGGATAPAAGGSGEAPAETAKDEFAAGRAVFQERCAVCHVFQGQGAAIGPDLTAQVQRTVTDLVRDILDPGARLSVEPVVVVTQAGERVEGVKKQETRELLRVYDASGRPPVLRTFYKDQIQSVSAGSRSPMPPDFGRQLTRRQLADLVSFLKGAPVAEDQLPPLNPEPR
jgi:putative heme-binding domain-containing protein